MTNVTIEDPTRMNILGLILGSIIERNLADPKRAALAKKLSGEVVVRCGEMAITAKFAGGETIRISRGAADRPKGKLEGQMDVLTDLTLGRGVVGHFFGRRIKLGGNILFLLRVWSLLRVNAQAPLMLEAGS